MDPVYKAELVQINGAATALDPVRKQAWLTALRSGEYQQGTGLLHFVNYEGEHRFCCLGVACEVAGAVGMTTRYTYSYDGKEAFLPPSVGEWFGFNPLNSVGEFHVTESVRRKFPALKDAASVTELTALNDSGWTFDEIADLIEYAF